MSQGLTLPATVYFAWAWLPWWGSTTALQLAPAAAKADALGLPFLCSSAVLDALTEQPTEWVARIAPARSHDWQYLAPRGGTVIELDMCALAPAAVRDEVAERRQRRRSRSCATCPSTSAPSAHESRTPSARS